MRLKEELVVTPAIFRKGGCGWSLLERVGYAQFERNLNHSVLPFHRTPCVVLVNTGQRSDCIDRYIWWGMRCLEWCWILVFYSRVGCFIGVPFILCRHFCYR